MQHFDLMVIGSGSGLDVSTEAVECGLSVAVVEAEAFQEDVPERRMYPLQDAHPLCLYGGDDGPAGGDVRHQGAT